MTPKTSGALPGNSRSRLTAEVGSTPMPTVELLLMSGLSTVDVALVSWADNSLRRRRL